MGCVRISPGRKAPEGTRPYLACLGGNLRYLGENVAAVIKVLRAEGPAPS